MKKNGRTIYVPKGRREKEAKKGTDNKMETEDGSNGCSANLSLLTDAANENSVREESSPSQSVNIAVSKRGVELYVPKGRRVRESKKVNEPKTEIDTNSKDILVDGRKINNDNLGSISNEPEKQPEISESAGAAVSKKGRGFGLYVPKGRREKEAQKSADEKMETEESNCSLKGTINQEITNSSRSNNTGHASNLISAEKNSSEEECPQTGDGIATTPKKDKAFEFYIPKGRKLLNEQKQNKERCVPMEGNNNNNNRKGNRKKSVREDSEVCAESAIEALKIAKKSCTEEKAYVPRIKDDEFFYGRLSDDDLLLCCLVMRGVSADLNDGARSNCIDFFLQRGAYATWRKSGECILVFRSESFLDSAFNCWQIQSPNAVHKVQRFNSLLDDREQVLLGSTLSVIVHSDSLIQRDYYCPLVGREAFSKGFKPLQRDTSVANRFIGAALGVRVPQNPRKQGSSIRTSKDDTSIHAATSNPKVIIDAWDD